MPDDPKVVRQKIVANLKKAMADLKELKTLAEAADKGVEAVDKENK
jgi:hypothetical protein